MNNTNQYGASNQAYRPQPNAYHQDSNNAPNQYQQQNKPQQSAPQQYQQQNNQQQSAPQQYQQQNNQQQSAPQQEFDPNHAPGGKFYSIKVHGGSAALEVKADVTRKGFKTIRVESAKGANKSFNWDQKVSLQLTASGLIEFLNAFLFIKAEIELRHYGVNNDKSLKVTFQKDKLFAQVSQKGSGFIGTPISMLDAIRIGQFALDQYLKNYDNLSADVVVSHLKRAAEVAP